MSIRSVVFVSIVALVQLFSPFLMASPCSPNENDCTFYLCQDQWRGCSSSPTSTKKEAYLVDFGFRYCQKFLDLEKGLFSSKGQTWLSQVRYCLMEKMQEVPQEVSCHSLKRKANYHHMDCYYEKGFCDLSFGDKKQLMKFIGPELKRFDVLLSGLGLLFACGNYSPLTTLSSLTSPF